MKLSTVTTIRGIEVEVTATAFDGDDSVGIPYGPEEIYAETLDGQPFELTEEELDKYTLEFSERYQEMDSFDYHDWD